MSSGGARRTEHGLREQDRRRTAIRCGVAQNGRRIGGRARGFFSRVQPTVDEGAVLAGCWRTNGSPHRPRGRPARRPSQGATGRPRVLQRLERAWGNTRWGGLPNRWFEHLAARVRGNGRGAGEAVGGEALLRRPVDREGRQSVRRHRFPELRGGPGEHKPKALDGRRSCRPGPSSP